MNSKNRQVMHLLGIAPRDEQGRFTGGHSAVPTERTISFDGGARGAPYIPSDPGRDHAQFLLGIIAAKQGQHSDW